MRKFFLGLFFSYLISEPTQSASSQTQPSTCLVCDSFVICGHNGSHPSDCLNDAPCTKEQEKACKDLFPETLEKVCDRPGVFPDNESPKNYYRCWISSCCDRLMKQKIKCPENTIFVPQALLCLNEKERKIAELITIYKPVRKNVNPKISCKEPGFYSYPQDCTKYYYCDDKLLPKQFNCPFGTYYNYKMKKCTSKLTPFCKSQLNKLAKIQRLNAIRLMTKIKRVNRDDVPSDMCMKFCENDWPIVTQMKLEGDEYYGNSICNSTYKVSLALLNKYKQTVLQLDSMIENITKEEKQELQSYDIPKPKKLKGFTINLIIKILLKVINDIKLFLRQYIRERISSYHSRAVLPNEDANSTTSSATPDSTSGTTKGDSATSTEPSDCTTESTDSSSQSEHFDCNTRTTAVDSITSTEPSDCTTESTDSSSQSEHFDCNTRTTAVDSTTSTEPSDCTTESTDSSSQSEYFDCNTKTTAVDSTTSTEPTNCNTETTAVDSTTSTEPTDCTTETTVLDSTTSTESTDCTTESTDSSSQSEHFDCNTKTTAVDSTTSTEPSDCTTESTDSSSQSEHFDCNTKTTAVDSTTSTEPTDCSTETTVLDSTTSTEPTDCTTESTDSSSQSEHFDCNTKTTAVDSTTSTEPTDCNTETTVLDSTTSTEPTDCSTETTVLDSTTSTEPTDCSTETTVLDSTTSTEPSDSTTESTDSSSQSEYFDCNTKTTAVDSTTSTESTDCSTETTVLDSTTSTESTDCNSETTVLDSTTSAEPTDCNTETTVLDSTTSTEPTDCITESTLVDSTTSSKPFDSTTETVDSPSRSELFYCTRETVELNRSHLPFCSNNITEPSKSSAKTKPSHPTNAMEFIDSVKEGNKSKPINSVDVTFSTQDFVVPNSNITEQPLKSNSEPTSYFPASSLNAGDLNKKHSNSSENNRSSDNSMEDLFNENESFKCTQVGVFRDPNDCHSYYRCTRKVVPIDNCPLCKGNRYFIIANHYTCRNGKYFSSSLWKCVKAKPVMCP